MPQLPEILRLALEFRARLASGEETASRQVIESYSSIFQKLKPEVMRALQNVGDGSAEAQFERARLGTVLKQLEAETSRLNTQIGAHVADRRDTLIEEAGNHARALTHAALLEKVAAPHAPRHFAAPTWKELSEKQIEHLTAHLHARPVDAILKEMAPDAVDNVRSAMLGGLGTGQPAERIARGLGDVLGQNAARAATLLRTEDMRAYRSATSASYEENADVIKGWRWVAGLSGDTCIVCLLQHGSEHEPDEEMDAHPNCRCVSVPITASWAELGFPHVVDVADDFQTGPGWFDEQSEEVQRRVLGSGKFDAWQSGDIALDDLRGHKESHVWGGMNYEVSLSQALKNAASG